MLTRALPLLLILANSLLHSEAFVPARLAFSTKRPVTSNTEKTFLCSTPGDGEEGNEEGMSLAADFSKLLQERNIQLDDGDFLDDDDEDEDDEEEDDDDDEPSLSDDQVYRELDERVLETAGGFVDLLSSPDEDDDGDAAKPKVYEPPTTVPDSSLTAGDVVMTVLAALNHNDVPSNDRGVEILFGYSSPGSAIAQAIDIEGMTPNEYGTFLKEEYEYKILFNHADVIIEKGDYSFDKKKAFFTARLQSVTDPGDFTNVNFILSTDGVVDDDVDVDSESTCWMIDSLLIRPEGMRRRRRR